jgi:3-hydroxyisobutyrate dehydrogenase-like beta-hydroxyacid dehydrogenase
MKISVLGLGIIGGIWAANLREDGFNVHCWNRTPKDVPGFCPSLRDAVEGTEFIIIVVADPPAVQAVLEEIRPCLKPGQTVIQSSTISASWSRLFDGEVRATGAHFLEAPFTGSKPAAEQRKTVFYLGGDVETVTKARPVLERLSGAVLHIGPVGTASSLKLAMNLNIAGVAQALCESLALSRAEGISDDTYFAALKVNASRSGVSDLKEPKLRARDYSPQFSVKHMAKDLRLARETAAAAGVPISQTERLIETYQLALDAGWSDDDFIGLLRVLEERRGGGAP